MPFNLTLTKVDKEKNNKIMETSNSIIEEIKKKGFAGICSPIVHLTSAHTDYGLIELKSSLIFSLD